MNDFFKKFITITRGSTDFFRSREVLPPPIREVDRPDAEHPGAEVDRSASTFADRCAGRSLESGDLGTGDDGTDSKSGSTSALGRVGTGTGTDSLVCPYCASKNYTKRGFRQKKLERVQLMICNDCGKTFTPHLVKGKHYPLATIFDAISLYNLGFSLEESCRRTASEVASVVAEARDNSSAVIPEYSSGIQKEETGSPVKLGMTGVSDAISGGRPQRAVQTRHWDRSSPRMTEMWIRGRGTPQKSGQSASWRMKRQAGTGGLGTIAMSVQYRHWDGSALGRYQRVRFPTGFMSLAIGCRFYGCGILRCKNILHLIW